MGKALKMPRRRAPGPREKTHEATDFCILKSRYKTFAAYCGSLTCPFVQRHTACGVTPIASARSARLRSCSCIAAFNSSLVSMYTFLSMINTVYTVSIFCQVHKLEYLLRRARAIKAPKIYL